MFRFLTSGESHGKMLLAILEGIPNGLEIDEKDINIDLERRQKGYGRGDRSKNIEKDEVNIVSGVRWGKTIGTPIGLIIKNKDFDNRKEEMNPDKFYKDSSPSITKPRPGHADLSGMLKYNTFDAKVILERASARNTASLVAVGAVCKKFLKEFGINILSYVKSIGSVKIKDPEISEYSEEVFNKIESSVVKCPDEKRSIEMVELIDSVREKGDTLGGEIKIKIFNVVPGIGSHTSYDRRLDSKLAEAMMGIPSVKEVYFGKKLDLDIKGSQYHDEIYFENDRYYRKTNNAGGIEGGISNGETIDINIFLKPIPTLYNPLNTIDVITKEKTKASVVRSDIAVVPSARVVAEAMAMIKLTEFYLEKFGGDSLEEILKNFNNYMEILKK